MIRACKLRHANPGWGIRPSEPPGLMKSEKHLAAVSGALRDKSYEVRSGRARRQVIKGVDPSCRDLSENDEPTRGNEGSFAP